MKKIATTFFIFSMLFCWVQFLNAQCVQCDTSSQATGENASVIGTGTLASGSNSFAGGLNSEATGNQSFAFGDSAIASGDYSFVTGYQSFCDHNFSAIIGSKDTITQYHSYILGSKSKATGQNSLVIGNSSKSLANWAFSIGYFLETISSKSFTIGMGQVDNPLVNSSSQSLYVGFNSNFPTFIVARAPGADRTGRIGIGNVTDPQAKLHIRSDWNESALIRIENTNTDSIAGITFGDGSQSITTSQEMPFTFNSGGRNYSFQEGNTGFGTDEPQAKVHIKEGDIFIEDIDHGIVMKSPDGNCWRGTLNNQGQLQFIAVDCDELTVTTPEPKPTQNAGIRIYPNPTGDHVTVEIPAGKAGARLSIKSTTGSELATKMLNNTSNPINMGSYPAEVYVFYIYLNNELLEVKKVVKE